MKSLNFRTGEKKMNFIMATLTILTLSICGPNQNTLGENIEVIKPTTSDKTETIKFKKVPTKWVKITKKSN